VHPSLGPSLFEEHRDEALNNDAPRWLGRQIVDVEDQLNFATQPVDAGFKHVLKSLDPKKPAGGNGELGGRIEAREPWAFSVAGVRISAQLDLVVAFTHLAWYKRYCCTIISKEF
jgi:hypothetical protein